MTNVYSLLKWGLSSLWSAYGFKSEGKRSWHDVVGLCQAPVLCLEPSSAPPHPRPGHKNSPVSVPYPHQACFRTFWEATQWAVKMSDSASEQARRALSSTSRNFHGKLLPRMLADSRCSPWAPGVGERFDGQSSFHYTVITRERMWLRTFLPASPADQCHQSATRRKSSSCENQPNQCQFIMSWVSYKKKSLLPFKELLDCKELLELC